jgi:hypothetical protein
MGRRRSRSAPVSLFAFQDIVTATTGIFIFITIILALALVNSRPAVSDAVERPVDLESQLAELVSVRDKLREEFERSVAESMSLTEAAASPSKTVAKTKDLGQQEKTLSYRLSQYKKEFQSTKVKLNTTKAESAKAISQSETLEVLIQDVDRELARISKRYMFKAPETDKTTLIVQFSEERIEVADAKTPDDVNTYGSMSAFKNAIRGYTPGRSWLVLVARPSGIELFRGALDYASKRGFDFGTDAIGEGETYLGGAN